MSIHRSLTVLLALVVGAIAIPAQSVKPDKDVYVLELLTRSIDLDADLEILTQELQVATVTLGLVLKSNPTELDKLRAQTNLETARIDVERARRKIALIETLIRSEIRSTEAELTRYMALRKARTVQVPPSAILRLESKLSVLKSRQ